MADARPAIVIAGTMSGVGKTVVARALVSHASTLRTTTRGSFLSALQRTSVGVLTRHGSNVDLHLISVFTFTAAEFRRAFLLDFTVDDEHEQVQQRLQARVLVHHPVFDVLEEGLRVLFPERK